MNFKKAKQNRIFQDIVDQIEEAILNGRIKPDERLPAERDLCEQFRASRGTLREALRILEQKGLIEIRLGSGGGAFVRDSNCELMTENLTMLIRSEKAAPAHLLELQEGIEATVASLAAKRATAGDIADLKKLVLKAQQYKNNGPAKWEKFVMLDDEIQQEIGRIGGNPIYGFLLQAIHDNIDRYYDRNLQMDKNEIHDTFQDLRMMVYAIGRNDASLAARQARARMRRVSENLELKKWQQTSS